LWEQATLAPGGGSGTSILLAKIGNAKPIVLCSLREGLLECTDLGIVVDGYTEFIVEGAAAIHLAGNYLPADAGPP
jgi:hypothetical protein